MEIPEIMEKIKNWDSNLVEVTGGEPLFQGECIHLLNELMNKNYEVLLETGGSLSISDVPIEIIKIVDFKCPSSGMEKKNLWSIVNDLQSHDEVKFVIGNREDFDWAKEKLKKYSLNEKCSILFSPTFAKIDPSLIVELILEEDIPARIQLQMHKYLWESKGKGV